MSQEHSLFCQCFKIVNIGHFAVESESQTSSPSPKGRVRVRVWVVVHGDLSPSPSHQKSDSSWT